MKLFAISFALAAVLAAGNPALARSATATPLLSQTAVTTKDLDLNSKAGVQTLMLRLNQAAAQVCGAAPDNRDLESGDDYRACTAKAVSDAVRLLGNTEVSAAYGQNLERAANPDAPKS